MAGRRPDFRVVAKNKDSGETAEVGAIWTNNFGGMNLKAVEEEAEGKLPLKDVLDGRFYLNIWPTDGGKKQEDDEDFPD